jgi:hypothetical protein
MRPLARSQDPPSADEAVARLRLWFCNRSLRELETRGVLDWDRDEHVVKKGGNFDGVWGNVPR